MSDGRSETWIQSGTSVRGPFRWALVLGTVVYHFLSLQWFRAPPWKDNAEASHELQALVAKHAGGTYVFWAQHVGRVKRVEFTAPSGIWYQATIEPIWDDKPGGVLRILFALDDGGVGAYHPLTDSLLVDPPETTASGDGIA